MVLGSVHSATQRHHQEVRICPSLGSLASCWCPIPRTASLNDQKTVAKLPGLTVILSNLQRQTGQCYTFLLAAKKVFQKPSSRLPLSVMARAVPGADAQINQWHRNGPQQSGKTNWDAPPGRDPCREGEGGGLNRSEFF